MATTTRDTNKVIKAMMVENTGASMLDSGGIYGRNYDKNKGRDFDNEPACQVETMEPINDEDAGEVIVTYNTYKFLVNHLERDEKAEALEAALYKLADSRPDDDWGDIIEDFANTLELDTPSSPTNTYNFENILDQVIWYTNLTFKEYDEEYIILRVHGGCDVRGGYTDPKIFRLDDLDYWLCDMTDVTAYAPAPKVDPLQSTMPGTPETRPWFWSSDDGGYNWYADDDDTPKFAPVVKDGAVLVNGRPVEFGVNESH